MLIKVVGYLVVFMCFALYTPFIIRKLKHPPVFNAETFYFADRNVSTPAMAATVFTSWLWTTSIIGAGEAGIRFGLSGGWAYSVGASIGFLFFIPLMSKLMGRERSSLTLTQYVRKRYGRNSRNLFYIFSTAVVIYIVIEQAVGIGNVFSTFFGISFKVISFFVVIFVACISALGGMKLIIKMDLLLFFLISMIFIILCALILPSVPWKSMIGTMPLSVENPVMEIPSGQGFKLFTSAGLRYTLAAVFIAAGQVYLDPGFFSKAVSAGNRKVFTHGFLLGGLISWIPVSILCALLFGLYPYMQALENSLVESKEVIGLLKVFYDTPVQCLFAGLVFLAGNATIAHGLVGIQTLFGMDYYSVGISNTGTDRDRIQFSRTATILLGLFCALIALALDRISLLTLDNFSGVLFAAPCAAIIMAAFSEIGSDTDAVISIIIGITSGFVALYFIKDSQVDWYYAPMLSFFTPFLAFIPSWIVKVSSS